VTPPSATPTVRRLMPGMASTASAGVIPTPAVVLNDGTIPDVPNITAVLGCGAKGSLKAIERVTQASPGAREPLNEVVWNNVV